MQDFLGNYSVPSQWTNFKRTSLTRKNGEANEKNVHIPGSSKDETSTLHDQSSNTSQTLIGIQNESIKAEGYKITEVVFHKR